MFTVRLDRSRKTAGTSGQHWVAARQAELRQAREQRAAEGWRDVDRELTPEQLAEIRMLDGEGAKRSRIVWVEYCHRALGWVVARGRYVYLKQHWIGRDEPVGAATASGRSMS